MIPALYSILKMKTGAPAKRQSPAQISWEQILANLDDGVIALDTQSKIIFFNEASEMLTDISSGTAVDQSFEKIFKREPWLIELVKTTHEDGEFRKMPQPLKAKVKLLGTTNNAVDCRRQLF